DEVIFSDGPSRDEENGEFPSRWDMVSGNTEIVEFDGGNVIALTNGHAEIVPYLKNSAQDYLPEIFTIEFDAYFSKNIFYQELQLYLYDRKNQTSLDNGQNVIDIHVNGIEVDSEKQKNKLEGKSQYEDKVAGWRHIAIAYTKGKLKVYMDATRLINIPHSKAKPLGFSIELNLDQGQSIYIKNVRIAKGGVKYYDRLLSDGKIVVNGIRFDIGQSDIKSESNGAINKIVKLMSKNSAVNLSIEGHTDSDGETQANQTLSQARAKAVMARMVALGIAANRLKSKGLGESKPLDNNSSAEGKANNRRVEFVKF
ncbi:MAG: OOP family OmpA-OmpF porin, partial [Psychromonas sp.]|uniref:OmpA family protein n=1 Tax=Psychromonas sp. TaxID=1884585 RepID=UPI0039E60159